MSDPVTTAIAVRTLVQTAFELRALFSDSSLTEEEKDARFDEILEKVISNQLRKYEDYDPNLDADASSS